VAARYEFHFDFLSPNAYLAHRMIPSLEARTGVEFRYIPVSIMGTFKATGNKPTPVQIQGVKNKGEYIAADMRRFCAKYGITYHLPKPFPFDSRPFLTGTVIAEREGVAAAYIDAIFTAAYDHRRDMTDPQVIEDVLDAGNFPKAAILAAPQDESVQAQLKANVAGAVARGAFGSPNFFVGDEMFFGKDRLDMVEDEIARVKADV
jgi:2-hydroxychromene-2-carboxylate isomerase